MNLSRTWATLFALAVTLTALSHGSSDAGNLGDKLEGGCQKDRCPACHYRCKLESEIVDETKKCFTVEEDVICIPRVVFPWQKTACNPCPNNGSFIKKVKLLGTKKYKCPKCEYSWTPEKVPACGCRTGCGCGSGYDTVKLAPELPAKAVSSVPTVALAADTFEAPVEETWVSAVDSSDDDLQAAEFAPVHIEPLR